LEKAKVSTVVSKSMVDYVKKQSSNALVDLNPIVVNSQKIFFNSTQRELVRRQLNVENKLVFLYSGSLGMYGVNIPALVKLLKLISASFENAFFVFITGERNELVSSLLKKAGILKENSFITESKSHDLSEWLSTADFGIHALPKQLDSSTRLGTKVVEYWVAGLPTIVNKYVGAAAQITEEYQIGFVVHDEFKLSSEEVKSILDLLEMDRNKIREIAMDIFDSRVVAQKYINSYTKCLK
jgi:glycosyltransferase involved in cell wall biosynthesis